MFDERLGRWAKAEDVHFVAGQARESFLGHSVAEEIIVPQELVDELARVKLANGVSMGVVARDWALIRLRIGINVRPVRVKAISSW